MTGSRCTFVDFSFTEFSSETRETDAVGKEWFKRCDHISALSPSSRPTLGRTTPGNWRLTSGVVLATVAHVTRLKVDDDLAEVSTETARADAAEAGQHIHADTAIFAHDRVTLVYLYLTEFPGVPSFTLAHGLGGGHSGAVARYALEIRAGIELYFTHGPSVPRRAGAGEGGHIVHARPAILTWI